MARFRFQQGQEVAGRLDEVFVRPIENGPQSGVTLLRLEFAVYTIQARNRLLPSGALACREVVVGPRVDATKDSSLMAYAQALGVRGDPSKPDSWIALKGQNRWIRITFGPPQPPDHRNPFRRIAAFDVGGYEVHPPDHPDLPPWATVKQVANALKLSEASVRRKTDELERTWGTDLVRRTDGGHRRINLQLLQTIRNDD